MNDTSEINYGLSRIQAAAENALEATDEQEIVQHLINWLKRRDFSTAQIFVMSFSEKRDDLNQWRSYTPEGQGVCIGFNHGVLVSLSQRQGWDWSNCKYEGWDQERWAESAVTRLVNSAVNEGPSAEAHPDNLFDDAFQVEVELLLRIACRIKHPAFGDEHEWRFISNYMPKFSDPRIKFRTGAATLVPYTEFDLGISRDSQVIQEIIVGPTMHQNLSINAISAFLSSRIKSTVVSRSGIPYRPL